MNSSTAVNEDCDLQLYEVRTESLEKKIVTLENNEIKLKKRIDEYANRETLLENQFKDLSVRYEKLQSQNFKLEEEKCELEEIENDTRLEYQRLEHDFIYLDSLSKKLSKHKTNLEKVISESNQRIKELEEQLERSEQHNYELEERECELNQKIDNLTSANRNSWDSGINGDENCDENNLEKAQLKSTIVELNAKIEALEKRESSYIETLQLGDEIWMQMEQNYKKKLQESHEKQTKLEQQLMQLMGGSAQSSTNDGQIVVPFDERLSRLEDLVSSMRTEIEQLESERSVLKKTNFQLNNQIDAMIVEQNRAFEILHNKYMNSSKSTEDSLQSDQLSASAEELVPLLKPNNSRKHFTMQSNINNCHDNINEHNNDGDNDDLNFGQIKSRLANLTTLIDENLPFCNSKKSQLMQDPLVFIENLALVLKQIDGYIEKIRQLQEEKLKLCQTCDSFIENLSVRKLNNESFIIRWTLTKEIQPGFIIGYEIYLNNCLYQRVRKPDKTNLVIFTDIQSETIDNVNNNNPKSSSSKILISLVPLSCYGQQLKEYNKYV